MKRSSWAAIRRVGLVSLALLPVRSSAAQTLPAPVTTITSFPIPAPGIAFSTSLRFGPDGLIYAWDGQQVWRQSGVNVDSFGAVAFGTVPSSGADAGPINFSQNGQTILIGNGSGGYSGSNGLLYAMPSTGGAAAQVGTVMNHFDVVPAPAASTIPGSGTKFMVDVGSADFATSGVAMFDYATGQVVPLIQNIPGASSSIAFDSANRLYVGIGYGHQQGQIRRFTLPLLDLAASSGSPLNWGQGQLINSADNNSGSGMLFDARGNLFVGGPDGVAVIDKNGASQLYGTGIGTSASVMYNATNDQFALNTYGSKPSIYKAADFSVPAPPAVTWNVDSGGNWSNSANWNAAAAPNGVDHRAVLGVNGIASQNIALDVPVTLGTLTFDRSSKYLVSGQNALTMQVSGTIAAINIAGGSHEIAAPVVLAGDTDVTVTNSADTLTLSGGISGNGMLSKEGNGVLIVTGANTYAGNTGIDAGKLRFAVTSGTSTVAAGATVSIAPGATLELAAAVSALGAAGSNRARIINDSMASGLVVSGTTQVVGAIDGTGSTTIGSGGDLTADHVNQSSLVIGGNSTNFARVTIVASDSTGNPLSATTAATTLADSLFPRGPFGEGLDSTAAIAEPEVATSVEAISLIGVSAVGMTPVTVPEPRSFVLTIFAIMALVAGTKRRA